jgi:hypothetical protein
MKKLNNICKNNNICKIINNVKIVENPIQSIKFAEHIHLWYNDNAVIYEIIKYFKSNDINILKDIVIWYNINGSGQQCM